MTAQKIVWKDSDQTVMLLRLGDWNPRWGLWSTDTSALSECLNSLFQRKRHSGFVSTMSNTIAKEGIFYSDNCLLKEVPGHRRCVQREVLDVAGAPSWALEEPSRLG